MAPLDPCARLAAACLGLGGCVVLTGCINESAQREIAAKQRPPLPVMTRSETPARVPEIGADDERISAASRLARAGDAAAAVHTLTRIGDVRVRSRAAADIAAELLAGDFSRAMEFARALPEGEAQARVFAAVAPALVRNNPAAAWDEALATRYPGVRHAMAAELARADPRPTLARIAGLPDDEWRDELLRAAAAAWARNDADDAVAWLGEIGDEELKRRATPVVAFAVAHTDPPRAIALAETLPEGRERWLLFAAIAQTWVAADAKAALAWARQLPAGEARAAALAGIDTGFGVPSGRGFAVAGDGGAMRAPAGAARGPVWTGTEPPGFAAWRVSQGAGLSYEDALLQYVRERGALEPSAVGQWIGSLPGGLTRDRAAEAFVDNLARVSPEAAANWLSTLPRSDRSAELVEKTAEQLLITNPAAAEEWMDRMRLPPHRQEELLRRVGPR